MRHKFFLPLKLCRTLMYQADPNQTDTPLAQQSYSLATLLFAMTVCSLWMLWLVKLPWMAILALLFLLPAITRSIAAVNVRKRQGLQTPIWEKISILLDSCIFCLTAILLGSFTWFATSFLIDSFVFLVISNPSHSQLPATLTFNLYLIGLGIGFFVGLIPAFIFLYNDWPRVYDVKKSRFLARHEIQGSKRSQPASMA